MSEINDKETRYSFSLSLLSLIISILLIIISIYFPWWIKTDTTVGPLSQIYIYKYVRKMPFTSTLYFWNIKESLLRDTLLISSIISILSLCLAIGQLLIIYKNYKLRGLLAFSGFLTSIISVVFFSYKLNIYLISIGDTFTGSIGFLTWGHGLGWKTQVIAAISLFLSGISRLLDLGEIEFELEIEEDGI